MATTTTNYDFILPAVADPIDEDLWGGQLNTNFSSLDDILPTPAASKYGAIAVQNNADFGLDYITSQGSSGQVLTSNGADALPSFQNLGASTIINLVYPVGSYYINETDNTNPGTLFGVGTWVAVTDKFIVGHGSTYTTTGGAASVTLVQNNLPASITLSVPAGDVDNQEQGRICTGLANPYNTNITMTNSGGGQSFSIIPPYQAAYIWKRTV